MLLGVIAAETPAAAQAAATLERFAATPEGLDALSEPVAVLATLTALNSSSKDLHAPLARLLHLSCSKPGPSAQAVVSEGEASCMRHLANIVLHRWSADNPSKVHNSAEYFSRQSPGLYSPPPSPRAPPAPSQVPPPRPLCPKVRHPLQFPCVFL